MKRTPIGPVLIVFLAMGCSSRTATTDPGTGSDGIPAGDKTRVALTDLGTGTYLGFPGGLYPGGLNTPPSDHQNAGIAHRNSIRPLDINGNPAANGKYVLISIGMSNTTQEWCSQGSGLPCDSWTLMGRAATDAAVNKTTLVLVNGAAGGQDAEAWTSAGSSNYDRVRDTRLVPFGLSEKQVQVAWIKQANASPNSSLPASGADAFILEQNLGRIVRAMKVRYPNLQQVFFTSRIYAGYATSALNPEPYAYESGFSVKWLIEAQITQSRSGTQDSRAGDLSYAGSTAPWLAWGPYLWANGTTARSDGLTWVPSDFSSDGTHPSQSGESKVAAALLDFFKTSTFTKCWFLAGQSC